MRHYRIGEAAAQLGVRADTLRYYERIGLLPKVGRNGSARRYTEQDLSRLQFVRRAQAMNFTLTEIGQLLKMRESPTRARNAVRQLTQNKLAEVQTRLGELRALRNELTLLLNLCAGGKESCPIIRKMDKN